MQLEMNDIAFLDFEASSLEKNGYPIEIAWVFSSGGEESYLIRPAPDWTDWAQEAEAVHGIERERLLAEGAPHDEVARRMVHVLTGHTLYASAPSWDGQWLSKLLRAAGLPRHALRLQDTDVAHESAITRILQQAQVPASEHAGIMQAILSQARERKEEEGPPVHRALADARRELDIWRDICRRAEAFVSARRADGSEKV